MEFMLNLLSVMTSMEFAENKRGAEMITGSGRKEKRKLSFNFLVDAASNIFDGFIFKYLAQRPKTVLVARKVVLKLSHIGAV